MMLHKPLAMVKPNGRKVALPEAICIKYGLREGSIAPFSGLPIEALNRKLTPEEQKAEEEAARMQNLANARKEEARAAQAAKKLRKRRTTKKRPTTKKKATAKKKATSTGTTKKTATKKSTQTTTPAKSKKKTASVA